MKLFLITVKFIVNLKLFPIGFLLRLSLNITTVVLLVN